MSYLCSSKNWHSREILQNKGSCQGCASTICTRSEEEGFCACHENVIWLSVIYVVPNAFLQNRGLSNQRCAPSMVAPEEEVSCAWHEVIMFLLSAVSVVPDIDVRENWRQYVPIVSCLRSSRETHQMNFFKTEVEGFACMAWGLFRLSAVHIVPGICVREKGHILIVSCLYSSKHWRTREMRVICSDYQLFVKFERYPPKQRKKCVCAWHEVILFGLSAVYVILGIDFQGKPSNDILKTRGTHGYLGWKKVSLHGTR